HRGLVSPELAIMMAYAKIYLYGLLLESDLPDDEDLFDDLQRYFPPPLGPGPARPPASPDGPGPKSSGSERYAERMKEHRLRREIVATVVANQLVERVGTTFVFRLRDETGAPPEVLARGYAIAREVFEMRSFWESVEQLDNQVDADLQLEMLIEGRRLVERSTRWLVENEGAGVPIAE